MLIYADRDASVLRVLINASQAEAPLTLKNKLI